MAGAPPNPPPPGRLATFCPGAGAGAMAAGGARALHWVFKVGDRTAEVGFLRGALGMRVLRHEEFAEGCAAACNGPYAGRWSKTMVGFGPEASHFVLELTYNYGLRSYARGDDFRWISIASRAAHRRAAAAGAERMPDGSLLLRSPNGYGFRLVDADPPPRSAGTGDPVTELALNVADLGRARDYWAGFLGMRLWDAGPAAGGGTGGAGEKSLALSFGPDQALLRLFQAAHVDHAEAYGRVAFALPGAGLKPLEAAVRARVGGHAVLTPYVSLDTPGKATVEVVILADPDGYEICFVGAEGFGELSQIDPQAESLLQAAMDDDKAAEWFAKHPQMLAGASKD